MTEEGLALRKRSYHSGRAARLVEVEGVSEVAYKVRVSELCGENSGGTEAGRKL
jgi:hypothetical protein